MLRFRLNRRLLKITLKMKAMHWQHHRYTYHESIWQFYSTTFTAFGIIPISMPYITRQSLHLRHCSSEIAPTLASEWSEKPSVLSVKTSEDSTEMTLTIGPSALQRETATIVR